MPRRPHKISIFAKWRMNKRMRQQDLADATGLSLRTVARFETGFEVSRLSAAKYLDFWNIDLNDSATWPPEVRFVDRGSALAISLEEDSIPQTQ